MAQPLHAPLLLEEIRLSLQGAAKNSLHRLWGEDGPPWGTAFDDLEALALQIGQVVAQHFLQHALQRQALAAPPAQALRCPSCGRPVTLLPAPPGQERPLQTKAGDVLWPEPQAPCEHCRKAFSPSEPRPGA
jgi:hypothetical protein